MAAGGTALDPEVVAQLLGPRRRGPLTRLSLREREVLGLMAEGRSNAAIAKVLVLTVGAVEKHVANILSKLELPPSESDHRRVLAVLEYLNGSPRRYRPRSGHALRDVVGVAQEEVH